MKNNFTDNIFYFLRRNIDRIVRYRLRSFFNLSNNKFDAYFSKNIFLKKFYTFFLKLFLCFRYFLNLKANIPQLDFIITTNCTLNCENCATLIPYYDKSGRYNINFDEFKSDLDKLLSVVDRIYRLKLIGGEPFIVKDLDKMLKYACEQKQIVSVEITTNGTIIPSDKICSILNRYKAKALVVLSDYSNNKELSGIKFNEVRNKLEKYGVYTVLSGYNWFTIGKMQESLRSPAELKQTFENCWQKDCAAFSRGIFYNCTRAIAVNNLTDYCITADEAVNIKDENLSSLIRKINIFYSKSYFSVCKFCQENIEQQANRAIQINNYEKPKILRSLE